MFYHKIGTPDAKIIFLMCTRNLQLKITLNYLLMIFYDLPPLGGSRRTKLG